MDLCARHEDALVMALELRGLLRPSLIAEADVAPLVFARQQIEMHATHFAGRATLHMLEFRVCPLCFVNKNPSGVNLDGWVDNAADEALDHDIKCKDDRKPVVTE
jgi:hypothetical protein